MLKWVVCAFGALLTIWGLWWGLAGWSVVEVERGWSSMIAGAIIFASGAIIIAIAALMMRLDTLINVVSLREPALEPAVRPETRTVRPLPASTIPAPPFPKSAPTENVSADIVAPPPPVTEVSPPPPAVETLPAHSTESQPLHENAGASAPNAVDAAIAAAATAAIASAALGADEAAPEAASSPEIRPQEAPKRPPPTLKVIENAAPARDIAPPPSLEKPAEPIAPQPADERMARRPTVPVPPLAPAPAYAEWPASPVAKPAPAPPLQVVAPRAMLPPRPPMPAGLGAATVATSAMAAAAVAAELAKPAVSEEIAKPVPEKPDDKPEALDIGATAEAKPEPAEITPTQSDAWVEKLFEELDQIGEAPVGDGERPQSAQEKPAEPESAHAEAERIVEAPAAAEASAQPSMAQAEPVPTHSSIPAEEPIWETPASSEPASAASESAAPAAEAEPAPPARTLVRKYDSQGVTYHLFDDGSIDAVTSGGTFHFGSLDELRAFIEKRSA